MDTVCFEPRIRSQMKEAIASVFLREGHGREIASDAGEMFVRLIEMSMTRLENEGNAEDQPERKYS